MQNNYVNGIYELFNRFSIGICWRRWRNWNEIKIHVFLFHVFHCFCSIWIEKNSMISNNEERWHLLNSIASIFIFVSKCVSTSSLHTIHRQLCTSIGIELKMLFMYWIELFHYNSLQLVGWRSIDVEIKSDLYPNIQ